MGLINFESKKEFRPIKIKSGEQGFPDSCYVSRICPDSLLGFVLLQKACKAIL
jgi:hypothetical protein